MDEPGEVPSPSNSLGVVSNSAPFFARPRRFARQRASDADRELSAQVLRDAFARGRLDSKEFYERSSAVWAAKRHGDLTKLVDDLGTAPPRPAPKPSLPGAPTPQQAKRAKDIVATVFFAFSLLLSLGGIGFAFLVGQRSDETVSSDHTDMLTPDGIRTVVDAFVEASGESRFVEITLDRLGGDATVSSGRDLTWSGGRVTEVDRNPPADDARLFDAHDDLELDGIGELVESATELTDITGPVTKSLKVRRTDSGDRRIEVLISIIHTDGITHIIADYKGDVITTDR